MPDKTLSNLPKTTSIVTNDILYAVEDPGSTPTDKKVEAGFLLGSLLKESHIDGFITANNGTDSDHDIDFGAGTATVSDGTNCTIATTSSTTVKQLDAAWAVGTNAGGLDTGAIAADTWYHMWVIMRADTHVVDFLFSTSATSPTLPTSYTYYRRIGAVLTDGSSNIVGYTQIGDMFTWGDTVADVNLTTTSTSWADLTTLRTPANVRTMAWLISGIDDVSSNVPNVQFWHGGVTAPASGIAWVLRSPLDSSGTNVWDTVTLFTSAADPPVVQYKSTATTVDLVIYTLGWTDPRGRTW